jgi:hypothetical protein
MAIPASQKESCSVKISEVHQPLDLYQQTSQTVTFSHAEFWNLNLSSGDISSNKMLLETL